MRKLFFLFCLCLIVFAISKCSCSGATEESVTDSDTTITDPDAVNTDDNTAAVATGDPRARVFIDKKVKKENTLIVISKKNLSLTVYEKKDEEVTLVARYPICLSLNKGQKEGSGDMRTPESEPGEPFTITEIKDASTWEHDFGDGRGQIPAYGHWFLRLSYGHGIGIHGSTNNRWSVPGSGEAVPKGKTLGRDSEGCIRLLDEDIIHLHDNYAHLDMPVYIKQENQGDLAFEKKAVNRNAKGKLISQTKKAENSTVGSSTCSSADYDKYSESKNNE